MTTHTKKYSTRRRAQAVEQLPSHGPAGQRIPTSQLSLLSRYADPMKKHKSEKEGAEKDKIDKYFEKADEFPRSVNRTYILQD